MEEDMNRFTFLRDSLNWEYATKLRLFTRRRFWFSQRIYTFSGMFYITFPQFMARSLTENPINPDLYFMNKSLFHISGLCPKKGG